MQVQMCNGVSRVFPDVHDESVTALVDPIDSGHGLRCHKHVRKNFPVRRCEGSSVHNVPLWNNQHVGWGGRSQITKRQRHGGFIDDVGGNLTSDNFAKNTIHDQTLSKPRLVRPQPIIRLSGNASGHVFGETC
jgi:hypothetical protein